ncbi:MAG TPA: hypothetical protein VK524_29125 [Polyangiaceae bacterium]|nr:hypothetical protein [Polyangiaceae bacterium]
MRFELSRYAARASALLGLLFAACMNEPAYPQRAPDSQRKPQLIPVRKVANARVYDRAGRAHACQAPASACPPSENDRKFFDECSLRGYYLRKCGCEQLCTGKVSLSAPHYDARGQAKACAGEKPDCTAPETSARFQDACNDRGYKLVVCGCEWLCSGPPAETPP